MSTPCSLGHLLRRVSLLALLLTITACASPTVRTQPHPTPDSTPSPTATSVPFPSPLTSLLGPAPTHCPAGPQLATFTIDDMFGGGFVGGDMFVGRSPVWTLGLYPGARVSLEPVTGTATPSPYPSIKVMWIVGPNYPQPVTLSGHELSTDAPVWFDLSPVGNGPGNPVTMAVLDPAAPNRGDTRNASGLWNIWGILLYFFASGCYQITAAWAGGSWQMVIAVGR